MDKEWSSTDGGKASLISLHSRRVSTSDICHEDANIVVDSILSMIGFGPFQIIAFCLAGLTYFAFSCEVLTFSFISVQVLKEWNLNGITFAVLPAVTCVTNILGGAIFSYFADKYGRIWPYAASMTIVAVFIPLSAISLNYTTMIVFRALASIGIGGIITLVHPMLIEFLPVKHRGNVTILTGLVRAIGSCAAGGLAWWLVPNYKNGWRYFIIATAVPSVFIVVFRLAFSVESPRYLVNCNKIERSWKTLSLMACMNGKSLSKIISRDNFLLSVHYSRLQCENTHMNKTPLIEKFFHIFKTPYRNRTICLLIIYNTQNLAYYGSTLFLPVILQNLGFDPYFLAFIGFTAEIPGILLMAIIIEWPEFGRLNTLRLFTTIAMTFFFLFAFLQTEVSIPIFTVIIYFAMVPMTTLLFTYSSEVYPTEVRAMAIAFITVSNSFNGIWLPFVSGFLSDLSVSHSWLSPSVWGSMFIIQLIISFFLKTETRAQSLQDTLKVIKS